MHSPKYWSNIGIYQCIHEGIAWGRPEFSFPFKIGSVGSIEEGGRLMNVDVVVLDEVHYLSDISRGTVWEETVSLFELGLA